MPHVGYLCVVALNLMKTSVDDSGTSGNECCWVLPHSSGKSGKVVVSSVRPSGIVKSLDIFQAFRPFFRPEKEMTVFRTKYRMRAVAQSLIWDGTVIDCLETEVLGKCGGKRKRSQNFLHLSCVFEFGLVQFILWISAGHGFALVVHVSRSKSTRGGRVLS